MSKWSLRFICWYICVLFIQPQNRFTFLMPLHLADICILGAAGCHFMAATQEGRPLIRLQPGTILACILLVSGLMANVAGPLQYHSGWNSYIDLLTKSVVVLILIEAIADTGEKVWAVAATMMLATSWWIKGGLRLIAAGASYAGDRIMGPAVSLIENPNGFAYLLCVMIPLYLYFYQQSQKIYMKYMFLAIAIAAVYIVFETGSRTGMLQLIIIGAFLLPKYFSQHKKAIVIAAIAISFVFGMVGKMNVQRFKSIPKSIKSFVMGEDKPLAELSQDEHSAMERRLKNRDTWRLIKTYPLGIGMNPDESRYVEKFPYATGQVHNELMMAGKQMGFMGIALYLGMLIALYKSARKTQEYTLLWWPGISDLGWTFRLQALAFFVGGMFSPLPWNVVLFVIIGMSSSLWAYVQEVGVS